MTVRLNRKLILEAEERLADGAGGYTTVWTALGTLWAALEARSGREAAVAGGSVSRAGYRAILRAAPEGSPSRPRAGQRLREGTRIYAILSVAERDADARYLLCLLEEEIAP
jgi:head-tail adaptor